MMDYHLNGKTQLAEGACFWRHRPEPGGDTMSYYLEFRIINNAAKYYQYVKDNERPFIFYCNHHPTLPLLTASVDPRL